MANAKKGLPNVQPLYVYYGSVSSVISASLRRLVDRRRRKLIMMVLVTMRMITDMIVNEDDDVNSVIDLLIGPK